MIYKASSFNYSVLYEKELLIVNFKKGLSSFRVVTADDIEIVKKYISASSCEIDAPNSIEKNLIDGGFIIPIGDDEDAEVEMLQTDYIYNNKLQLIVHVTKDCNFRCKYCFINFEHQKLEFVVQEQIVDFIRKNINKYSGVYISWFGGEPLLGMDVISYISERVIDICKKAKKPYVAGMTTNGYLLTPENIRKLIALKVYSYCVTLDGLKESHDNQRVLVNGNPTFQKIVDNLRYIKNEIHFRYLSICVRTNFTKTTLENLDEFLAFFKTEFGDDHRFAPLFKLASDWGGERIDSIRQELLKPSDVETIYNCVLMQETPFPLSNITNLYFGGMTCNAVRKNKYTISTDGIISKCDTACEETKIGYIDSTGWHFDRVKEAKWLMAFRQKQDECGTCPFRCMCFQGACPKKKLIGQQKHSCPKPVFMNQLLLMYKRTMEARKEKGYE